MLKYLFPRRSMEKAGVALYAAVANQARQPAFFTDLGVADEIDARFELYTLHALLLILRLRDEDGETSGRGAETAQAVFDTYISALDNVLRELGVGDTSVARKMRNLGEALYGRMRAYEAPLRAGDADALAPLLSRNVYGNPAADGAPLAQYAVEARGRLAAQPFDTLLEAPQWPEIRS